MSIVSNSGPLINLAKVGHFSLLKDLFQRVLIPKGVFEEVVVRGAGQPGSMETRRARWISRVSHGYRALWIKEEHRWTPFHSQLVP